MRSGIVGEHERENEIEIQREIEKERKEIREKRH